MAKKSGAAVQAVFIETNSAFLCKGWPLLKKTGLPLIYRARSGHALYCRKRLEGLRVELKNYYRENSLRGPVRTTAARRIRAGPARRGL